MERWKLPPHYFGAAWEGYFVAPVTTNRDADSLTRSNWDVVTADLESREADEFWASSSVADRVDMIQRSGSSVSVFSARRAEVPHDDDGRLYEYLRGA